MANIIKKIKIKKQDGTFTDYIPIGAEAENINVDGESVETKLNKKPYYYNSIADMKADENLKVGDMAITLGYYEANDGGGAEYKIISGNYENNGCSYHELDNGLFAEIAIDRKRTFIKSNFLNLSDENSSIAAIDNFNKICSILNRGYNILFTKMYYVKNNNMDNEFSVIRDIFLYGETKNCGLHFIDSSENYFFALENGNVYLKELTLTTDINNPRSIFIHNHTKKDLKYKYGNVQALNCYFENSISLLIAHQDPDHIFEGDFSWGVGSIDICHCTFENITNSFVYIYRMPCKTVTFNNNRVHNFSHSLVLVLWNDVEGQESLELERIKWMDGVVAKNNYIVNDNDWFGIGSIYYTIIATKSRQVLIENNYVEGMKSLDIETSLNPFYTIGEEVIIKNNVYKNNVNFSGYMNMVFKSKGSTDAVKYYLNNTFIVEEDFLNTINNSLLDPYSSEELINNCTFQILQNIVDTYSYVLNDNIIDIPYLKNQTTSTGIVNFIFNNNNIKGKEWTGDLFIPQSNSELIQINNNVINIDNYKNARFSLINASVILPKAVVSVCNNNIKFNNATINCISFAPPTQTSVNDEIIAKNIIIQNNNIFNYGAPTTTNTLFNTYKGAVKEFINFKDNYFYTKGQERFWRLSIATNPITYDLVYEGTLFNTAESLKNSVIQLAQNEYTRTTKYKLELTYDSTEENHLVFYFTLYRENNNNYISYKSVNGDIITSIIRPSEALLDYIYCETDPTFVSLCRVSLSSSYSQIFFNKELFQDNLEHKVHIKLSTI